MNRRIRKRHILFLAFLAALCASCAGKNFDLKDGYYTAEIAGFDEHGWKEYVTICVSAGRITLVEYNAINASGFIKSWDMRYMRLMNATDGTYPNAYTRYYGRQFLDKQGTDGIDRISGATDSYHTFIRLADTALENARQGNTETTLVSLSGVYGGSANGAR
jgi:major membrane immunogen (membrane-anchored lipoprotein)